MQVLILCVGHLKERWQKEACQEYLKRLSRYGSFEVREVDDQSEPDNASPAVKRQIVDKEGALLMRHIRPEDNVVALAIAGDAPDSVALSQALDNWAAGRRLVLVIGGSLGLSEAVYARANHRLSFSNLTFPHGLMRVILLEQLYRARKISAGQRYHK